MHCFFPESCIGFYQHRAAHNCFYAETSISNFSDFLSSKSRFLFCFAKEMLHRLCYWKKIIKKKRDSHPSQRMQSIQWKGSRMLKREGKGCCAPPKNFPVCFNCVSWGSGLFDSPFSIPARGSCDSFSLVCQTGRYPFLVFQSSVSMHRRGHLRVELLN